jgi:hypothetical protein
VFVKKLVQAVEVMDKEKEETGGWVQADVIPKKQSISKLMNKLLGNAYTVNPSAPIFRYASVLTNFIDKSQEHKGEADEQNDVINDLGSVDNLYKISLVFLFVYIMIAITETDFPSLAFLHCLALVLLDSVHATFSHGDMLWTPGKKVVLLVLGRVLIMSSGAGWWVFNYSIAYVVYSSALLDEVINRYLPVVSKRQAEMIAFAGDDIASRTDNIAGSGEFSLGLVTFAFCAVITASALSDTQSELPATYVNVWGAKWLVYVFGLIALCITVSGGLISAAYRAYYLQKNGLLRGWAERTYFLHRQIRLPLAIGIFAELSIITSGILIYGATNSPTILVVCIFLPPVLLCLGHAYNVWVKNDYDLVIWPPKANIEKNEIDSAANLQQALNMVKVFDNDKALEEEEIPESMLVPHEQTLKGFELPKLEVTAEKGDTEIKMPALPMKSVLRRKRQTMGECH